jgi:hypothetical protein
MLRRPSRPTIRRTCATDERRALPNLDLRECYRREKRCCAGRGRTRNRRKQPTCASFVFPFLKLRLAAPNGRAQPKKAAQREPAVRRTRPIVHSVISPPLKKQNRRAILADSLRNSTKVRAWNLPSLSSFSTARYRTRRFSRVRFRLDSAGSGRPVGVSRPFRAAACPRADASPNEESSISLLRGASLSTRISGFRVSRGRS